MTQGRVTTLALNLRSAPGGAETALLMWNETVTITGPAQGGWLPVSTSRFGATLTGWVSGAFIAQEAPAPAALLAATPLPPADDAAHQVTMAGRNALGPDGTSFATAQKVGFYTKGVTGIRQWAAGQPVPPPFSEPVLRVVAAVSANEAVLEGINSYDGAFLSFGLFQWTLGTEGNPGELPGLLAAVAAADAAAFAECFGRYGIATAMADAHTGFLILDGAKVETAGAKGAFRSADWAYRFWRAGHDPAVREAQAALAAARIGQVGAITADGLPLSAWLTSEQGVALALDQHVNAPAYVPGTLQRALNSARGGLPTDPKEWGDAEEARLITAFEAEREATSMYDPAGRARVIAHAVLAGQLSAARNSFAA